MKTERLLFLPCAGGSPVFQDLSSLLHPYVPVASTSVDLCDGPEPGPLPQETRRAVVLLNQHSGPQLLVHGDLRVASAHLVQVYFGEDGCYILMFIHLMSIVNVC